MECGCVPIREIDATIEARSRRPETSSACLARQRSHFHRQPAPLGLDAGRADHRLASGSRGRGRDSRSRRGDHRGIGAPWPRIPGLGGDANDARLAAARRALSRAHGALACSQAALHRQVALDLALCRRGRCDAARRAFRALPCAIRSRPRSRAIASGSTRARPGATRSATSPATGATTSG